MKFLHALDFLKTIISTCKLNLLEPLKQPHLKMKIFFKTEMLNPNNEKYSVKTIGYKLQSIIYGSITTVTANLISLAIIGPRVKFHFQLPSLLVL